MSKHTSSDAEQVVSIRVPKGLPDEVRIRTGLPFSQVMRTQAIHLLNILRQKDPSDDSQ